MSSGIRQESGAGKTGANAVADEMSERVARLGMTPRQQELNHLWSWYRCEMYNARKYNWDGHERVSPLAHEAIASGTYIPPGFYDAGGAMGRIPYSFRKPSAPYALVKVIVDRFTGLLFSERRHPNIRVEGDEDTEDFVCAIAEVSRLWPSMIQARQYGGAMGSCAVGFQFIDGKPVVEVHDPRWLLPEFEDRFTLKLSKLEKRYMFPQEERDPETGYWHPVWYWYRRVIDKVADTLYKPFPVGDGEEPPWDEIVDRRVEHGIGFVPAIWAQNLPVQDDIDGDPDCHGVYDMIEAVDALIAQANRGTVSNCDPTLHISTDLAFDDVKKGTGNAIKTEKGGGVGYVELTGTGPKSARELAQELRTYALEVAQCVLDHPDAAQRTATEIERVYSSMLAKADVLREQYGERCIKPLLEMMVAAARAQSEPRVIDGQIVRGALDLPPNVSTENGKAKLVERRLGPGGVLKLKWPGYFEPTLQDVLQSTQAAVHAKVGGLIDGEHASNFVAEYFRVEDVPAMLEQAKHEASDRQAAMEADIMTAMPGRRSMK